MAAVVVAAVGFGAEYARFGGSDEVTRERVAARVQQDVASLAAALETGARSLSAAAEPLRRAQTDPALAEPLFEAARAIVEASGGRIDSVSVYDAAGQPIAWAGRPPALPVGRLQGPAALFVAPGPLGLRLVSLTPIEDGAPPRRLGAVAAESALTRQPADDTDAALPANVLDTGLVPVTLRPRFEGAGDEPPPHGFLIESPDGEPLLEAEVSPSAIAAERRAWRGRVLRLELLLLAGVLVVLIAPIAMRRARTRDRRTYLAATAAAAGLIVACRAVVALAVPATWLSPPVAGEAWLAPLLRSPIDLFATALGLLALVVLGAGVVERCRLARRSAVKAPSSTGDHARLLFAMLLAGAAAGALLAGLERVLWAIVSRTGTQGLQFALHPLEPARLSAVAGVVLLNAAVVWAVIAALRLAATSWRVRVGDRRRRLLMAAVAGAPMAAVPLLLPGRPVSSAMPVLIVAGACLVLAATLRTIVPRYRRASQTVRLTMAFLALVVPSLALYPELVILTRGALDRIIERVYAPQALAHRRDLNDRLDRALVELDLVPDLADQLEPSPEGAGADAGRAFFLWSQTELGRRRLTSSVELYAADGTLVSRFALNLPAEFLATERPADTGCTWDVFGEALASTDDQVLLHAGRAICVTRPDGSVTRVGVVLVHVVLDYGTLPFLTAQNPYEALVEGQGGRPHHGREVLFAVYGWGRTPVYPTEGTAWPISTELLRRIYRAGRNPFWEELVRGDRPYRVLLSNDRAGIYAIGYPELRPVDHAVVVAEIVTLAGLLWVALGLAGVVVGWLGRYEAGTGRALLREIRQSFSRRLFLTFVAASVVPVVALAFVTRAYVAGQLREGLESAAVRAASVARRVVETVLTQQRRTAGGDPFVSDEVMVSVSRIVDQDVNLYAGTDLVATSQRDLFASGLLPTRTPAEVYRAISLERQASYVGDERLGPFEYTLAGVPVRDGLGGAILTVPQTLRQQEIEREIDDLDRRVTLAAVLFILVGALIGRVTADRIADPVRRLTRAARRIGRGDLEARADLGTGMLSSAADELNRLVATFNGMAADLRRQRNELERTNRLQAWADMARQVAHDIKNPLTPVQLSAEHLRRVHRDRGEPLGAVLDACVDTILSQVALLRSIASEFSSFASAPVARLAPTSPADVIEEVVAPYRAGLPAGLTIEVDVEDGLPELPLDRHLLARALVNLVENAIHAMPSGGTVRLSASRDGGGAIIRVADTGVGMDAEALARLFEPYFSTKATGTGLGLTIARRNVELNGGTIGVESEKGRGTTVTVRLPHPP